MSKVLSRKTWHLTADKQRAVPEGDPAGAFLLVAEGCEIDEVELAMYGLTLDGSGYAADAEPAPDTAELDPSTADNGSQPDDVPPAQ